MIHKVLGNLEGCEGYIDDIIVYGDTWDQHFYRIKEFLNHLREANLTVNLAKSEAQVTYLGHVVKQGEIKLVVAKVEAITKFPVPTNKNKLMRFLGMVGYY